MNAMISFINNLYESIVGQLVSTGSPDKKFGSNFNVSNLIGDVSAMLLCGWLGLIPLLMVAFLLGRRNL